MKNLKVIIGFAVFGFCLSFISGLFSGSNFGLILLHAFLFCLGFAVLGLGVSFVYEKYLNDGEATVSVPKNETSSAPAKGSEHHVNIVLESEELPPEENAQQFFVGSNHQMLNNSDVGEAEEFESSEENLDSMQESEAELQKKKIVESNNSANNNGFVPVSLTENAQSFSSIEAQSAEEIKTSKTEQVSSVAGNKNKGNSEDLDQLPDLEDIAAANTSNAVDTSTSEVVQDSDFAKNGAQGKDADEIVNGKDSALIAKAISTLIAKD